MKSGAAGGIHIGLVGVAVFGYGVGGVICDVAIVLG